MQRDPEWIVKIALCTKLSGIGTNTSRIDFFLVRVAACALRIRLETDLCQTSQIWSEN